MTRDEFDVFVRKLEKVAAKNPRLYVMRVFGLVALAYGYLCLLLLGSILLCILLVLMVVYAPNGLTIKIALVGIIAFGGMFLAILRGLWVKLEAPKGLTVTREQAPKLFKLLDELRSKLDCRPFHTVVLVGDLNAAVIQIPRLGIFGWHRNYLLVGLPLMQALSPEEFKAVLAHEFAHSSRGHGSFGNWLYRVRRTWQQIFDQMARRRSRFGGVLFKFINWYWPVFNGHAFVLARANEYEADACSVRLAGADVAASALMRLPVNNGLINEKFWPGIYSRANQENEPPADVLVALSKSFKAGLEEDEVQEQLRQSFLMETNNHDTHPCLKDRLQAIGRLPAGVQGTEFSIVPPPTPNETAAEFFFGPQSEVFARQLSEEWRKAIAAQWAARHEQAKKLATDLADLEKPGDAPPTAEQLWQRALKLIQLHSDKEALPVVQQVLALDPKHSAASFVLGRHKLSSDDPDGVALIEFGMDADPELTQDGCNLLYAYFNRTGQRSKIEPLHGRMERFQVIAAEAQKERSHIDITNTFLPHELNAAQVEELRKVAVAEPDNATLTIVRKQVEHFKNSPCFVIGLTLGVKWWKPRSTTSSQQLVSRFIKNVKLPGYFLVFVNEKNQRGLASKISEVPGANIYVRNNADNSR